MLLLHTSYSCLLQNSLLGWPLIWSTVPLHMKGWAWKTWNLVPIIQHNEVGTMNVSHNTKSLCPNTQPLNYEKHNLALTCLVLCSAFLNCTKHPTLANILILFSPRIRHCWSSVLLTFLLKLYKSWQKMNHQSDLLFLQNFDWNLETVVLKTNVSEKAKRSTEYFFSTDQLIQTLKQWPNHGF